MEHTTIASGAAPRLPLELAETARHCLSSATNLVLAPARSEKLGEVFDGGLRDMRQGLMGQERLVACHHDVRKGEQARENVVRNHC